MLSLLFSGYWITSCHRKCYEHTCINTLGGNKYRHDDVLANTAFSLKMSILKTIKNIFEMSYGKQNITLVIILYEIYQTRCRLV